MCVNKKIIGSAFVVAMLVVIARPGLAVAALPLMVFAICPVSMLLMARGMTRTGTSPAHVAPPFDLAPHGPPEVTRPQSVSALSTPSAWAPPAPGTPVGDQPISARQPQ